MLRSDFSREAHTNFKIFFSHNVVFQHIDVKSTSISHKIEVHIEPNFHFSVYYDVFNHFNRHNK